jgi:hypothetical protein
MAAMIGTGLTVALTATGMRLPRPLASVTYAHDEPAHSTYYGHTFSS